MFKHLFERRVILTSLLLLILFIPTVSAQDDEEDLCQTAAEEIEYGDTVEGSIDNDVFAAFFCFDGEEGDEVTVTVSTTDGDLVTSVFVTDPFIQDIFAEDTARNDSSNAEITLTLPDDAQYLIVVSREDIDEGDTEGDYELNLSGEGGSNTGRTSSSSSSGNDDIETNCDEEPLATLSQYQYGIPGSNPQQPLFAYNVGCTGFLVSTIAGRSEVAAYEIDRRGNLSFQIGDTTFTTEDVSDDEWVLDIGGGQELTLERLDDEGCDEEPLSNLVSGAWLMDGNVIDFTCNGIALLTLDGETTANTYEVDRSDITITLEDGELVLENFDIDRNNVLNAEVDGDGVELENVLN